MRRIALVLALTLCAGGTVTAQDAPVESRWASEWGPDDERGATNRLGPDKVLEALDLVDRGRVYSLGRTYERGMPLFGGRHYSLTLVSSPTGGPMGSNRVVYHDEMVSGELGQVGTQFDGLGHVGVRVGDEDVFYNGIRRSEMAGSHGLRRLGIENVPPIVTRGVLLDVAGHRGVDRLESGYAITPADLEETLAAEGVELRPGDAVLIRTGHGALWMVDNEAYLAGAPGIGLDAARWLVEREVVLVGADNSSIEVVPAEDPEQAFPVHELFLVRHGIHNLENLDLDALAADGVWRFAFVFTPLRLKGATGSPGNPIAIR